MPKYKEFAIKADGISEDGGTVTGYASTFDRDPDSYGDVVAKGAFAKSLERWAGLNEGGVFMPLLWGHNTNDPKYNIGRITSAAEDERGLLITAEFDAESEKAQYVRKLAREGRVYQFSFAYDIINQGEVELEDGRKANELRELEIYEVSVVQIPANQHAQVVEVKEATEMSTKQCKRNSKSDEDTIRQAIDLLQSLLDDSGPEDEQDEIDEPDDATEGGEGDATPKGREDVTIPLAEYKQLIREAYEGGKKNA